MHGLLLFCLLNTRWIVQVFNKSLGLFLPKQIQPSTKAEYLLEVTQSMMLYSIVAAAGWGGDVW